MTCQWVRRGPLKFKMNADSRRIEPFNASLLLFAPSVYVAKDSRPSQTTISHSQFADGCVDVNNALHLIPARCWCEDKRTCEAH